MNVEERLKELIIKQYGSMKDFSSHIGVPNSTLANILRRGVQNANVLTIIKICQALDISTDDLAKGMIVPLKRPVSQPTRIEDMIENLKQQLLNADHLTLDDKPATAADIYSVISAIDTAMTVRQQQARLMAYANKLKKDED